MANSKKSPNPIDVLVGGKVRQVRMMRGVSQEKLGDALGITFQQIQKYEKGTNRIGASRLQAIANILGVPVATFFEDAGDVDPAGGTEALPVYTTEQTKAAAIMGQIPWGNRSLALSVLRQFMGG